MRYLAVLLFIIVIVVIIGYQYYNFTKEGFNNSGTLESSLIDVPSIYADGKLLKVANDLYFEPNSNAFLLHFPTRGFVMIGKHRDIHSVRISHSAIKQLNVTDTSFFSTNNNIQLISSNEVDLDLDLDVDTAVETLLDNFMNNTNDDVGYIEISYKYDKTYTGRRMPSPIGKVQIKLIGTNKKITDADYTPIELPPHLILDEISSKSQTNEAALYMVASREKNNKNSVTREDISNINSSNTGDFILINMEKYTILSIVTNEFTCFHIMSMSNAPGSPKQYDKHLKTVFIQNNNLFTIEHNKPIVENGQNYTTTEEDPNTEDNFPDHSTVLDPLSTNFQVTVSHNIEGKYIYFAMKKDKIVGQVILTINERKSENRMANSMMFLQNSSIHVESQPEPVYTPYYKLPINVYIVRNMDVPVTVDETNVKNITGWINHTDGTRIMYESNEKFFKPFGIEWIPTFETVTIPDTTKAKNDMEKFNDLSRDTGPDDGKIRALIFKYMRPEQKPQTGRLSLYFITFLGHTRQGLYTRTNNGNFIMIGQHSNKSGDLKQRKLYEPNGTPSLTFTVAHELVHALGLEHLNTEEPNIMNGMTSSFTAKTAQIETMRSVASTIPAYQEEPKTEPTPEPYDDNNTSDTSSFDIPTSTSTDTSVVNTTTNNFRINRPGLTSSVAYINSIIDKQSKALCNRSCGGSLETFTNLHSYSLYSRE